jgi:hypothetical protein
LLKRRLEDVVPVLETDGLQERLIVPVRQAVPRRLPESPPTSKPCSLLTAETFHRAV